MEVKIKKSLIKCTNLNKPKEKSENLNIENKQNLDVLIQDNSHPLFDRKKSSDSTTISLSQEDILSQTSECNINPQPVYLNQTDANNYLDHEDKNYFYGIEYYFLRIMPEKFSEYKKTKNYLPKNNIKTKDEPLYEIENENIKDNNITIKDNITNNFYYPMNGNFFYYAYKTFYFNYQSIKRNEQNNNFHESKDKNKYDNNLKHSKTVKTNIDESKDEQDVNIYIIKKIQKNNNKNNNKNNEKNVKISYNETNSYNCNYNNNYNYKYRYKNYNYKKYNNSNNQRNDYNYNFKFNENKKEQKINNYNKNNFYNRKPCKIIYY